MYNNIIKARIRVSIFHIYFYIDDSSNSFNHNRLSSIGLSLSRSLRLSFMARIILFLDPTGINISYIAMILYRVSIYF